MRWREMIGLFIGLIIGFVCGVMMNSVPGEIYAQSDCPLDDFKEVKDG